MMAYTKDSEACTLYRRWVANAVIAAALQRKVWVKMGYDTLYPNLFIVLVGPAGSARKSVAMRPGRRLVEAINVPIAADCTTRAGILHQLYRASAIGEIETTELEGKTKTYINVEQTDCALTIFATELASFLGYREDQLLADLCAWYDCEENWRNATATQGVVELRRVWLNLIGAITPENILNVLPKSTIGGGLTSRMMMVYSAGPGKRINRLEQTDDNELWQRLYHDLEQIHLMRGPMLIDQAFAERYKQWYEEEDIREVITDPRFKGYEGRRADHLVKNSMVACASRADCLRADEQGREYPVLTLDDFDQTLALMKQTEKLMPNIFVGFGRNLNAGTMYQVANFIRLKKVTTRSVLAKTFYHDADKATLDSIIETLASMHQVRVHHTGADVEYTWTGGEGL
jgi:hypothetical protein